MNNQIDTSSNEIRKPKCISQFGGTKLSRMFLSNKPSELDQSSDSSMGNVSENAHNDNFMPSLDEKLFLSRKQDYKQSLKGKLK